jgi:hypothetical protein
VHEVIFGPHVAREATLLRVLASRVNDLRRDGRLRGFAATRRVTAHGHAAWQLFGLAWEAAPEAVVAWRSRERAEGSRTIHDGAGGFAALAWAPRVPFETWLAPSEDAPAFGEHDPAAVAEVLVRTVRAIARALRTPPIDLVLVEGRPWRVEILPRLAPAASIEVATGIPIHGTLPEQAAAHLRAQRANLPEEA